MALHLYYKCSKIGKWRRVPIDFKNHEEAESYFNRNLNKNGCKKKILFSEEEAEISKKRTQRKEFVKRGLAKTGKTVSEYAKATHERLKVAGPRDMDRIRSELGESPHKTITAYDTTLKEIRDEKRRKEREITAKDLRKLARKREAEKEARRTRAQTKRKEWKPPASPFGEFQLNLDRTPFTTHQQEAKKYETGGPGFKVPFKEVKFNPNVNPFGFELGSDKKKRRK